MTKKQTKSNLEKLTRAKRRLRVVDLLSMSSANAVLEVVSQLPGLCRIIVIAETPDGTEIYHNNADIRAIILELEVMKFRLMDEWLWQDTGEEVDNG